MFISLKIKICQFITRKQIKIIGHLSSQPHLSFLEVGDFLRACFLNQSKIFITKRIFITNISPSASIHFSLGVRRISKICKLAAVQCSFNVQSQHAPCCLNVGFPYCFTVNFQHCFHKTVFTFGHIIQCRLSPLFPHGMVCF